MNTVLREQKYQFDEERSKNALKCPTQDPAITLAGSYSPYNPTTGVTPEPLSGQDFDTLMQASNSRTFSAHNMSQDQGLSYEEAEFDFDLYLNDLDEDEATEKAPESGGMKMLIGPSSSPEDSHSDHTSAGSARSSFSANRCDNAEFIDPPYASEMNSVNRMTDKLVVDSGNPSPTDSYDSNQTSEDQIAGVAMPSDYSPERPTNPGIAFDRYSESVNPIQASSATMNKLPPTKVAKGSGTPRKKQHQPAQLLRVKSEPQISDRNVKQPYQQSDLSAIAQEQQRCEQMLYISALPPPRFRQGPYLIIRADRVTTRVETAVATRLILVDPPPGFNRVLIHEDHHQKVKHLENRPSLEADTMVLNAVVFCCSTTQTPEQIHEALSLAAKRVREPEMIYETEKSKPAKAPSSEKRDLGPVEVSPVTICKGCVDREDRRLRRSKKKPGETEEWRHRASRRTVVFNNGPCMEWKSANSANAAAQLLAHTPIPPAPPAAESNADSTKKTKKAPKIVPVPRIEKGTKVVDLCMRICCYCRHQQHEPQGFRVFFTLRNSRGQVICQQFTHPIMITDDHKDKEKKQSAPSTPGLSDGAQIAGQVENYPVQPGYHIWNSTIPVPQPPANFQQSISTPNSPLPPWPNSMMLTDDHKDNVKMSSTPSTPGIADGAQLVGYPWYFTGQHGLPMWDSTVPTHRSSASLQQSLSTPNLPLQAWPYNMTSTPNFASTQQSTIAHATSYGDMRGFQYSSESLTSLTLQNRSRPASPTPLPGQQQKRRKASGSARMHEQLQMTPIQAPDYQNDYPATSSRFDAGGPSDELCFRCREYS